MTRPTGCWCATLALLAGCGGGPGMFSPAGDPGSAIAPLGIGLGSVAIVITVVVCGLLAIALRRAMRNSIEPVERPRWERRWLQGGVAITVAILVASYAFTMIVLGRTVHPDRRADLTIDVIAHQWWWEIRYPESGFTTANEIHIPVGRTVRVRLRSGDVIHSFWVPALNGKTDLVPGESATTWLRADHAGRYQGRCAEYCGLQHAHMAFVVVAESLAAFEAWARHQREPAATPVEADPAAGRRLVEARCGSCHTVHGTAATGRVGPDLTHLASRTTIGAGVAANTRGHLGGWIADPAGMKPGVLMPRVPLAANDLLRIVSYLEILQ